MHETKYQPMEKADAEQIMEEILGMQCGLNPDQQVTCETNWLLVALSNKNNKNNKNNILE